MPTQKNRPKYRKHKQLSSRCPTQKKTSTNMIYISRNIISMRNCDVKFTSGAWVKVKEYLLWQNAVVNIESLYVCSHCCPILNCDRIPCHCVLNGVETEPIPAEVFGLDALNKQLIQLAKSFQTIVRLGTYTGKVPMYSSLKARKGTMFFLLLPMEKTLETLQEFTGSKDCPLCM